MFKWIYTVATNEFLSGGPCEMTPIAGQAVVTLPRNPKPRTERYDGVGGIRQATAQEISDYDAAQLTKGAATAFDGQKDIKAVAIWVAQRLNVPLATARQEIIAIRRGL